MTLVDRFSRDGTLLLGGMRAILLQVADPVIGEAVASYGNFATRPLDRLNNTLTFVYAVMLGSPDEAAFVARYTRRAHAGIPAASDPRHQLWVAATLCETALRVHERVHGALTADDAGAILSSYSALGTVLEVPRGSWPATPELFDAYWSRSVAALEVGRAARQVAHDLFHPVNVPWWLRAALPLVRLLTADLLGAPVREAYGMPWSRHRARRAAATWAVVRVVAKALPAHLLAAPSRHYLARLRARTADQAAAAPVGG